MNKLAKFFFASALALAVIPSSILAFSSKEEVKQADADREREVIDVESHNTFNMSVISGVLSWDAQDKATGYKVTLKTLSLEDVMFWESQLTAVPIISYLDQGKIDTGKYILKVHALGIEKSETMPYFYTSNVDKLNSPYSLQWLGNNAIWEYVEDANSYTLDLYDYEGKVDTIQNATSPTDLSSYSPQDGWTFTVRALGNGTLSSKRNSEIVESPKKGNGSRVIQELISKNMFKMKIASNGLLSWNEFPNAKSYHIRLKNINLTEIANWDVTNTCAPIISYMDQLKIDSGKYVIEVNADLAPNNPARITYYYTSNVNKLESPMNLQWIGGRAAWDSVEGATSYNLIVYDFEGEVINETISGCLFDCSTYNPKDGWTFKVRAMGGGTLSAKRNSKFAESSQLELPKVVFNIEGCAYDISTKGYGGGTVQIITDKGEDMGISPKTIATEGKQITIKASALPNYKFVAWKASTPFVSETFSTQANYTFTASEDLCLYAVFQPNFTVSFNANGGDGQMQDETGQYGAYVLPSSGFTAPEGQKFAGWSLTQDGQEVLEVGSEIDISEDSTIYAIWENYAFTQQPVDNAAVTTLGENEISPEWNVNFTAVKYEIYEDNFLIDTVTHKWFDISKTEETSLSYYVRAFYDESHFVDSNTFTLTWADEIVTVVYSLGEYGVGTNDIYYVKKNSDHTILSFDDVWFKALPGYSFDHWEIDGVRKQPGDVITVSEDMTVIVPIYNQIPVSSLIAKYNGTSIVAGNSLDTSSLYIAIKYEDGTLNELDYHQAIFSIGSNSIADISTYVFEETGIIPLKVVSEEKEAIVKIEVTGFDVSFDANGGSGAMNTMFDQYGAVELPQCGFIAPFGQEFAGWKLNGVGDLLAAGTEVNITANANYVAEWKDSTPETLSATYYGGNVEKGTTIDTGSIFISLTYHNGDKLDISYSEVEFYIGDEQIANIATYQFNIAKQYDLTVKYAGLSTHMMINVPVTQYSISFNPNGGSGTMEQDTHDEGEYHLPVCAFDAPEGMEFDAWEVDGVRKEAGEAIDLTSSIIVTALWKEISVEPEPEPQPEPEPEATYYTVSFVANGGTGEQDDNGSSIQENESYILPECAFTAPEGKEFDYWDINGGAYNPGDSILMSSDLTITAIWKEKSQPAKKKGCKSSVIAASALISITSLLGAGLLISKKKED